MKTTISFFFLLLISGLFVISCKEEAKKTDTEPQQEDVLKEPIVEIVRKKIDMNQFPRTRLNLSYTANPSASQTLDIIYPLVGEAPYRTIVFFHDGLGLSSDKQSETLAAFYELVNQGYALIVVNYRLPSDEKWTLPLHDAKAAIRFLREKSYDYQLDTERMLAWGISNGGYLSLMLGATNKNKNYENLSMGSAKFSSEIQGLVSWYPIIQQPNPIELVTKLFPPGLLIHGSADTIAPFERSVNLAKVINKKAGGERVQILLIDGAEHGDTTINNPQSVVRNLNFVDQVIYDEKNPYRNTNYLTIRLIE